MAGPTLRDVAKKANVSKSTVSLVLNNGGRISPETTERVWQAVRELNYVPSRAARALQSGRSGLLGLIVSDITNPYFAELARTVTSAARDFHYDVVTMDTDYNADLLMAHLTQMRTHRVDGLLVFTTERNWDVLAELERTALPAVLLNWGVTREKIGEIAVQYHSGIAALLDHLIELGHHRLAFVAGPSSYFSAENRAQAFLAGVQARRNHCAESLVLENDFRLGAAIDTTLVDQLMDMPREQRPTAVIASSDLMAIDLLRTLYSRQIAVPQQMSVSGMDDIVFANYTTPSLTTLRLPRRQMGLEAFALLKRLMDGTSVVTDDPSTTFNMRLIVRESTGPANN